MPMRRVSLGEGGSLYALEWSGEEGEVEDGPPSGTCGSTLSCGGVSNTIGVGLSSTNDTV